MCERVSQRDGAYLVLLRLPQQTLNRTILSINEDEVPLFLFFFFLLGLSRVKTVRVECVLALGSGIGNPLTLLWLVLLQLFAIQSDSSYQATYSLAA